MLINTIRRMKIYPRLIVSFIVIMITASVVILDYNSENYANKMKQDYYKNMEYTINSSTSVIESILKGYEQLGKNTFDNTTIINLLRLAERKADSINTSGNDVLNKRQYLSYKTNIGKRLYDLSQNDPYIQSIMILKGKRQYHMYSNNGTASFKAEGLYISDIDGFIESMLYQRIILCETQPCWQESDEQYFDYYNGKQEQENTLLLGMNNYNFNDDFNFTLIIKVDVAAITDMFSSYPYGGDGNILFVTDQGRQILLQQNYKSRTIPSDYNCSELIKQDNNSIIEDKINGVKSIIAYTNVPKTGMFVVNISDYANLLKGYKTIKTNNYLMVTVIVLLAIVVHYIITLSITVPLNRLKKTMDLIADDNLDIRYKDNSNDEITSIGMHLNHFIDRIKNLIDEAYITQIQQKEMAFRKKNAELNALQAQINPHFIYNTLDIIRWQTIQEAGGESKASHMIFDFSTMIRIGTKKSKDIIPISEEISHVQAYIKLVNYKFKEDPISINIQFSFDKHSYSITKLTLQPIVENCVIHGFIKNQKDRCINIKGDLLNDKIHLCIEDNGIGMSEEQLLTVQSYIKQCNNNASSVGLRNVGDRLKLFFGEDSHLLIESIAEVGTKVTVIIPYSINT